jgi:hypothetical protein
MRIFKRNIGDWMLIVMFIVSLQFITKMTVIAALIVWLAIVSEQLGLLKVNKMIQTIR